MTLCEFMAMNGMDKAIAARSGRFLAHLTDEQHCAVLYGLNDFYVEVYYFLGSNAVDWIRPWKSSKRLQTYLANRLN